MREWGINVLSVAVLCLMLLSNMWGCSKRVASSSGDETSKPRVKSSPAPVETIQPESMATIADGLSSTTESARTLDAPSTPTENAKFHFVKAPSSTSSPLGVTERGGLADIFFDFDQYTIKQEAQPTLEADAVWLKDVAGKSILIEGHCDERGTEAYNLVLGEKRARSTKRYLEDLGVSASRMKIISFGEIRPFCQEHDEICYQKNRRAHFVTQ